MAFRIKHSQSDSFLVLNREEPRSNSTPYSPCSLKEIVQKAFHSAPQIKDQDPHYFSRYFLTILRQILPNLTFERKLESGSLATAVKIHCNAGAKVLRIFKGEKAVSSAKVTHLSQTRIGGEWLSFLVNEENFVSTSHIIAYLPTRPLICVVTRDEFLSYYAKDESNQIDPILAEGPLIAIATLSNYHSEAKDLFCHMNKRRSSVPPCFKHFPPETTKSFTRQLVQGVANLHKEGLIHRDIKPENILWHPDDSVVGGKLRLFDTGYARFLSKKDKRLSTPGSAYYAAPELFDIEREELYTVKVDAYSLFVVIFLITTGYFPKPVDSVPNILASFEKAKKFEALFPLAEFLDTENKQHLELKGALERLNSPMKSDDLFIDLLLRLKQVDPDKRLSIQEAYEKHPFFQKGVALLAPKKRTEEDSNL